MRVTVLYPGLPPDVMDKEVAQRVARWHTQDGNVRETTTITMKCRAEVYFEGRPGADAEGFLASFSSSTNSDLFYLPPGAIPMKGELLADNESIPNVQIREVKRQQLELDRAKLAALGITPAEFHEALVNARPNELHPDLQLTIGKRVIRLGDVATIAVKKEPSHIVTKLAWAFCVTFHALAADERLRTYEFRLQRMITHTDI